jgi:predicted RNA-binding protein (virulence factor B family)
MNMGTTARLRAARETDNGLYFTDGDSEILLPRSEIPEGWKPGVEADLFLYRDSEDRPTATRRRPAAEAGQCAFLEVVDVSAHGAFAHWGLLKDLLIPRSEQTVPLTVGQKALVLVLLDPQTDRLFGTTKLAGHLSRDLSGFQVGQEVGCVVWRLHEQGWIVIVEHRWQGMLYRQETSGSPRPGEPRRAWISGLRDDGKIDLRERPLGFQKANPEAEARILSALDRSAGRLGLTDKSSSEEIFAVLGLSKKAFKTACGTLYKKGVIRWVDEGIAISTKEAGSSD